MTTLVTRQINLAFVLGEGSFGKDGTNAVDVTGLRTSCTIARTGANPMGSLNLRVWGLPLDVMQKLSVLNILAYEQYRRNVITVTAGDKENGFGVVFSGEIREAWVDANSAPDVGFILSAYEGSTDKVRPVPPTGFKGPVTVDTVLASLARQMQPSRNFENSGVDVTLDNPYYPGTILDQVEQVVKAAQCDYSLDFQTLAIWPRGKSRGDSIYDVSADTGLVGYPQFSQTGVTLQLLYSPALVFGQKLRLKSAIGGPADGTWVILEVVHNLDAEIPGGQWFTTIRCGRDGYPTPLLGPA